MRFMNQRALLFLAIFTHVCESVKITSEFHNFIYHNHRAPLSPFFRRSQIYIIVKRSYALFCEHRSKGVSATKLLCIPYNVLPSLLDTQQIMYFG